MSDRARCLVPGLMLAVLLPRPLAAEPAVTLLDLPFRAIAMRGPQSEVAIAVATSGLLPPARAAASAPASETGAEESAPIVVVWGEGGGAALGLSDGAIRTTLLGAETIEGLSAAETPRGALPGSRRAISGAVSAYLTGSTRAMDAPAAAGLTIRERQPVAMGGDPKPVPVSITTVPAGADAAFAPLRPRALRLSGRPAFVATTLHGAHRSGLALVARGGVGDWAVVARSPPQDGGPPKVVAAAGFSEPGVPQVAAVRSRSGTGTLQVWSAVADPMTLSGEASGYLGGEADTDLAATLDPEGGGLPELALPAGDGTALAIVSLKGGIRERTRILLPAAASFGVAALGRGSHAHLFVGLADGRVAVVAPGHARP